MFRRLKVIIAIVLVSLAISTGINLARKHIEFYRRKITLDISQTAFDQSLPLTIAETIGQTFVSEKNGLTRVVLLLQQGEVTNIPVEPPRTFITLTLVEENGEIVFQDKNRAKNIILRNYLIYDFPALMKSGGKRYYFYLQPEEGKTIPALQTTGDTYPEGTLFINHKPSEGDLAFRTYTLETQGDIAFLLKALIRHIRSDPSFFAFYGLLTFTTLMLYLRTILW